ncbi:MAG: hypothetical protein ACK55Z_04930 [bacterium]
MCIPRPWTQTVTALRNSLRTKSPWRPRSGLPPSGRVSLCSLTAVHALGMGRCTVSTDFPSRLAALWARGRDMCGRGRRRRRRRGVVAWRGASL